MSSHARPPRTVREPVQVYLESADSALLARLADELALPKAEVLRRGLRALATQGGGVSPMLRFVSESAATDASSWPARVATDHDAVLAESYRPSEREGDTTAKARGRKVKRVAERGAKPR